MNVHDIAASLERGERGIWFSRNRSEVSYPSSANETCYQIEDSSFWFQHRNRCIVAAFRALPPAGIVFDVGGGNGFVSLGLENDGWETVLVEPGITGSMNARERGLENVICSTLEDAGFHDHSLPAVGIFDVLEHVQDDRRFLRKINEVLIRRGRIYITVPAYQWLWSADDIFAGHFRRYTLSSLASALDQEDFDVEFASYIFAVLPVPVLMRRTIPSRLGIRSVASPDSASDHLSSIRVHGLLGFLFAWELKAIESQRSIPFGSSCLLVGRSRSG